MFSPRHRSGFGVLLLAVLPLLSCSGDVSRGVATEPPAAAPEAAAPSPEAAPQESLPSAPALPSPEQSQCQGTATQAWCSGSCIDSSTNKDHCGACNQPCAGGQACVDGACVCGEGQTLCDGECRDTRVSDNHCGTCGVVCGDGERCENGACGLITGDDGCAGLATGIGISHVAVYQSLKVPVMDSGASVPAALRNADIVAGRETVFRVYVRPTSTFQPRDVSARLLLINGSEEHRYYAKKVIEKSSDDLDPVTTFQISVPAGVLTSESRYSVELGECGQPSGPAAMARFPAQGDTSLEVRETGGIKIKLIPILANGRLPDVSSSALAKYKQLVEAMFPVASVQITLGDQIDTTYPIDWPATLDQLRSKRMNDTASDDVYYYGLIRPEDNLRNLCGSSCITGIGYVANSHSASLRVALGVGFADRFSAEVMAHELGHTMGRNHAPCVEGGSMDGVDKGYPYTKGVIGSTGYDSQRKAFLYADRNTDIMGYCSNKWISDYTYKALADRLVQVNGIVQANFVSSDAVRRWRVMLVDDQGPRWGLPITQPRSPEGDPIVARIEDERGELLQEVEAYRTEISDGGGASILIPEPQPNWHAVRISGHEALPFKKS